MDFLFTTASSDCPLSSIKEHAALSLGDLLMVLPTASLPGNSAVPEYTHFFAAGKATGSFVF